MSWLMGEGLKQEGFDAPRAAVAISGDAYARDGAIKRWLRTST